MLLTFLGQLPAAVGAPLTPPSYDIPVGAVFVAPNGSDSNPGTQALPKQTLANAISTASTGGTIVMRAGTYFESVEVIGKSLTIQNFPGEEVWVDGTSPLTGWTSLGGGKWSAAWSTWQTKYDIDDPLWPQLASGASTLAGYPEMVFSGNTQLTQVGSEAAVTSSSFFADRGLNRIVVGYDPVGLLTTIAHRKDGIFVSGSAASGTVIRGVNWRRFATPMLEQAAVKLFASNCLMENCVVQDTANSGVYVYDAVNAANVVIRNVTVRRAGQIGIGASQSDGLTVTRCYITDANAKSFNQNAATAGIKITRTKNFTASFNWVANTTANGIWLDQSCRGARIIYNRVNDSARQGIEIEISNSTVVAGNVVNGTTGDGIQVNESNDIDVFNNTILNVSGWPLRILEGGRTFATPGNSGDFDDRVADPWPLVGTPNAWQSYDIVMKNNVCSAVGSGNSFFGHEDVVNGSAYTSAAIDLNHNRYWWSSAGGGPQWVGNAESPAGTQNVRSTLSAWQSFSGFDTNSLLSVGGTNPYFNTTTFVNPDTTVGASLPTNVADALGIPPSIAIVPGLPGAVRWTAENPSAPATDNLTFTGSDNAAWGSGWTFTQGAGDVLTNRGRMVTGTSGFAGASSFYNTGASDSVVSIDVEVPTNDAQFPEVRYRFSTSNYDYIRLLLEPHNDTYAVHSYDNDVQIASLGSGSFAVSAGDIVHVKMMGVGTSIYVRLWKNSDPEPSTWNLTGTSTLGQTNTQLMVRTVTSNLGVAVTNFWDSLKSVAGSEASATAATGTGSASNATVSTASNTSADAADAAATGIGYDATTSTAGSGTDAAAGDATATGAASDATTTVAPTGTDGSGTGSGQNNTATVNATAIDATATGTAYDASVSTTSSDTNVAAGDAAATGAASDASTTIQVNAEQAVSTGTAYDATVSTASLVNVAAGDASSTGTGYDASITLDAAGVGTAASTSTSNNADTGVSTAPETAASAGSANEAGNNVALSVGQASATGSGQDALGNPGAGAGTGTGSGTGSDTTSTVALGSEAAAATGIAYDPLVLTGSNVFAAAEQAVSTGTGFTASTSLQASGADGSASGTGVDAGANAQCSTESATATGVAYDATVQVGTFAAAESIAGFGQAFGATVQANTSSVTGTATGTAYSVIPSTSSAVDVGCAEAAGQAFNPSVTSRVTTRGTFWNGARWVTRQPRYWDGERWVDLRWNGQKWYA